MAGSATGEATTPAAKAASTRGVISLLIVTENLFSSCRLIRAVCFFLEFGRGIQSLYSQTGPIILHRTIHEEVQSTEIAESRTLSNRLSSNPRATVPTREVAIGGQTPVLIKGHIIHILLRIQVNVGFLQENPGEVANRKNTLRELKP